MLANKRMPFHSLDQQFYINDGIFNIEMKKIWQESWLFAGWTCQLPDIGNYFTFKVGNDSIIIIRGDDNKIRAFHNLCRHRGSKICTKANIIKSHVFIYFLHIICYYVFFIFFYILYFIMYYTFITNIMIKIGKGYCKTICLSLS